MLIEIQVEGCDEDTWNDCGVIAVGTSQAELLDIVQSMARIGPEWAVRYRWRECDQGADWEEITQAQADVDLELTTPALLALSSCKGHFRLATSFFVPVDDVDMVDAASVAWVCERYNLKCIFTGDGLSFNLQHEQFLDQIARKAALAAHRELAS
jgi:hypothetical protein